MKANKTAIVTGASRGIGAVIAERLGTDGFNVVVNYSSSEKEAGEVRDLIKKSGGEAIIVQADVAKVAEVKAMFDLAEKTYGGVDVLVNNAGIVHLAKFADADEKNFDRQVAVNFKGPFNTLREAALRLREGGSVINLSTSVVGMKLESYGVYAATKAAVETMTAIFAKEMRGRNINVNAVAPGPTATDLFLEGKPDEVVKKLTQMTPLERLGQPNDIAGVVSFLAGKDGQWVNGQVIRSNGGIV